MPESDAKLPRRPGTQSVEAFLERAKGVAPSQSTSASMSAIRRLIFAIDATASRQPTWDLACELHAELFADVERLGNVAVQLAYFRGLGDFKASAWLTRPDELRDIMLGVHCAGGRTQIVRLLEHVNGEATRRPVRALIFVGDCFEESEAALLAAAGQLAIRGVPLFIFQEGNDQVAAHAFSAAAAMTGGAHVPFDPASPDALRELLGAAVRLRRAAELRSRISPGVGPSPRTARPACRNGSSCRPPRRLRRVHAATLALDRTGSRPARRAHTRRRSLVIALIALATTRRPTPSARRSDAVRASPRATARNWSRC
jgi:hypothetical protein